MCEINVKMDFTRRRALFLILIIVHFLHHYEIAESLSTNDEESSNEGINFVSLLIRFICQCLEAVKCSSLLMVLHWLL